ncbi:nicotinamidase-like isoform X2 [Babylonia areolata]
MLLTVVVAVVVLTTPQLTVRGHKAALLIIDVQDCFLPGGSLAVPEGEQVIPVINQLREEHGERFNLVVISQDWHCADHVSFFSQHPGSAPYTVLNLTYNAQGQLCHGEHVPSQFPHAVDCSGVDLSDRLVVPQTLWPDHCVMDVTSGPTSAAFSPLLTVKDSDIIVKKGHSCGLDSYSAFYDNGGFHQTELHGILQAHGIELVVVTGLALDYCVYYTSKDARALGYKVLTVTDACRGVAPESTAAALEDLKAVGVELVQAGDVEGGLQDSNQVAGLFSLTSLVLTALLLGLIVALLVLTAKP